jgi:cobalamin-dependent methionine synthase I
MLARGYRGSHYSFGYPACHNLADRQQLLALRDAEAIGVALSEEDMLDPSNPPPPSSSTTRKRSTSRCEGVVGE